jgi:16S rRNA (adenine1518-N6/adenine1519-N6)-dimethyltransferase
MLSYTDTRKLLESLQHLPKRSLGQNFLVDANIVRKQIEMAEIKDFDNVVEIGPGLGTLTIGLLEKKANVYAIEYDKDLLIYLRKAISPSYPSTLHLEHGDAVDYPLAKMPKDQEADYKIVSNLPYSISSPWLASLLGHTLPKMMILMLQKEAADRFTCSPGTKAFSSISIPLKCAFDVIEKHDVSAKCFFPEPRVDSVLIKLQRKEHPYLFHPRTRQIIGLTFTQRRKQIGRAIQQHQQNPAVQSWLDQFELMGLSRTLRPEQIELEIWKRLDAEIVKVSP